MPEKKNISILLKSLLVICCMAAGMISVYLICRNITFYFKAKRYQEKLAEQRTAREKQEEKEAETAERLRKARKENEEKRLVVLARITEEAEQLSKNGNIQQAIDFLKNYHGDFIGESTYMRDKLIEKYEDMLRKKLEASRNRILEETATLLLERKYQAAEEKLAPFNAIVSGEVFRLVSSMPEIHKTILKTFKNDLGSLILISLQNGSTVSAKLLKIQDDDLLVEQNNMEKKIKVTELLIHEKEKRLEDTPPLARELFLGIEYWNLKNETEAGKYFRNIDNALGKNLQELTGTSERQIREKRAEQAFYAFLRENRLSAEGTDHRKIGNLLAVRKAKEQDDRKLMKHKQEFCRLFSGTSFFKKQTTVLNAIDSYLDKKIDYLAFERLPSNSKIPENKLLLQKVPPETFWDIPVGGKDYRYAVIRLTELSRVNLVFSVEQQPKVWIAYDDDSDFMSKTPLKADQWQTLFHVVKFRKGKNTENEPFALSLRMKGEELFYRTACKRVGKILLDGRKYCVELINTAASPDYGEMKNVILKIYTEDKKREISVRDNRFHAGQKACSVSAIMRKGDHIAIQQSE